MDVGKMYVVYLNEVSVSVSMISSHIDLIFYLPSSNMNLENRFTYILNAEYIQKVEEEEETFTADEIPETGGV